jgi:DNA-binding SARP family transcriptional activator
VPRPGIQTSERGVLQEPPVVSFGLLGPLEVLVGRRPVLIPGGKQRALLAVLLLRANETVPLRDLKGALWGDVQPASPRSTVQKYVMRLRRLLEPTGSVIHTDVGGYRLEVRPDQVDVHRFGALAERGRRMVEAGDWGMASALLTEATGLWRAVPPLGDVYSEQMHLDEVPRLVERYLQAVELRVEADMHLGRHSELCGELLGLVRRHPLRERFWEQRIRALYAAHRQGEALAAYREVSRLLADELGVDPGPALQAVHQQILVGSGPAVPVVDSLRPIEPALRQLPMATSGVVGRAAEIAEIVGVLSPARWDGQPRLVVVSGPEGVGKSTVAVHAAHQLASAFPDGQLYAELGDDEDEADPARRVGEVLGYFLRALGMPGEEVPHQAEDAVAAFRSMTADRRLLVVLDGAPSACAVRALLPGSAGCGVIVSTRRELAELFVSPGAHALTLGMLRLEDSYRVLSYALGVGRVRVEQKAADELVRCCRGLPLAVRSAAAHLATRPGLSIASYLEEVCSVDAVPRSAGELRRLVPVTPARTAC